MSRYNNGNSTEPNAKSTIKQKNITVEAIDRKVAGVAAGEGFKVSPIRSVNSKVHELTISRAGITESIYIDRGVGLSKDQIQVVIRSEIAEIVDRQLLSITGVEAHYLKTGVDNKRRRFSSNYTGFRNKGSDPFRHEHFGQPYRIDISENFNTFKLFLQAFCRS